MPRFESKPTVADGITPVDPNDLITKKHLDDDFAAGVMGFADNGYDYDFPRPDFAGPVYRRGYVQPSNMLEGDLWQKITSGVTATGGTLTTYDDGITSFNIHTFGASDDFVVTQGGEIEYLIVGGGGSGGGRLGGVRSAGGGAGGLISSSSSVAVGTHPVVVGVGGVATIDMNGQGIDGGSSSFKSETAIGGGGGGGTYNSVLKNGRSGGSGGGATYNGIGGSGTPGQGNDGGDALGNLAAGGGGAGAKGEDSSGVASGDGGDGVQVSITGSSVYYAGGGGGGTESGTTDGGLGGGGGGTTGSGVDGTDGLGGGGGGNGGGFGIKAGDGGDGIVIIRYAI